MSGMRSSQDCMLPFPMSTRLIAGNKRIYQYENLSSAELSGVSKNVAGLNQYYDDPNFAVLETTVMADGTKSYQLTLTEINGGSLSDFETYLTPDSIETIKTNIVTSGDILAEELVSKLTERGIMLTRITPEAIVYDFSNNKLVMKDFTFSKLKRSINKNKLMKDKVKKC